MVIMVAAIVSTKLPIWAGHDLWIFHAPKIARYGFWSMAPRGARRFPHASRISLPADRRRRPVVGRRRARPPRFGRSRRERVSTNTDKPMTDPHDATRRKLVIAASAAGAGLLLTAGNAGFVGAAQKGRDTI
jgi:hypothetical protein